MAGFNRALYRMLYARQTQDRRRRSRRRAGRRARRPGSRTDAGTRSPTGAGTYGVRMIDEGGKISLNRADEALLRKVFETLGLDIRRPGGGRRRHPRLARQRRPAPPARGRGRVLPEAARALSGQEWPLRFGRRAPPSSWYYPRAVLRDRRNEGSERTTPPSIPLREVFSVFNRSANINVRTAPVAVLRVVLGGEEDAVEEILTARRRRSRAACSA